MSVLRLRVKHPSGDKTVKAQDESFDSFRQTIASLFQIKSDFILLCGYPPRPTTADGTALISTFLKSGETIMIKSETSPSSSSSSNKRNATSKPATKSPSQKKSSSTWNCAACTFENQSGKSACSICQTAKPGGGGSERRPQSNNSTIGEAFHHKIPDDNSCLFHAASFLLNINKSPSQLRSIIADTVRSDSMNFSSAILGKSRDAYISYILDSTKWGGQVELNILSTRYKIEIAAIDIQSGRIDIYGTGSNYQERVYMLFSGIHFDAVTFGAQKITKVNPQNEKARRGTFEIENLSFKTNSNNVTNLFNLY